jgi:anti-sigma factor RsiW
MAPYSEMWTCEQIEGRLSDYVDHLLAGEELRAFEAHFATCPHCTPLVKSVTSMVAGLHHLEPLEAPAHLASNILDRTLGPRKRKQGVRAWLAWLRPVWQPRFAYGALSLIATVAVLLPALGVEWRKPQLADLNPVNMYRAVDRRAHLLYARGTKFVSDLRVVYEIQSRLRPEPEQQPAPQPTKAAPGNPPGQSNGPDQKSPRDLNRARDRRGPSPVLACALTGAVTRSLP